MSTTSTEFSELKFLEDLEEGSQKIGSPYSEEVTKTVLKTYNPHFHDQAVQIRASSQPGEAIAYRLISRAPIGALDIGIKAGFLNADNEVISLLRSWQSLYDSAYEQADFQADIGLTRAFLFLGATRSINEIIGAPFVPETITRNRKALEDIGLDPLQVVEANIRNKTVAFYFIATGPLTREQAANFTALAGAAPPSDFTFDEMSTLMGNEDFFLTVTMDVSTGKVVRVDFYILFPIELPGGRLPDVGPVLTTFWDVPTYDVEVMEILCWSFGEGHEPYMQAERGYSGDLRTILRDWKIMSVN